MKRKSRSPRSIARATVGVALLLVVLCLPQTGSAALGWPVFPVLLPIVLLILGLCRGAFFTLGNAVLAIAATLLLLIELGDIGTTRAYGRVFNPVVDMGLLPAAWHLAAGTFGLWAALGFAALIGLGVAAYGAALFWGLGALAGRARKPAVAIALATVTMAAFALLGVQRTTGARLGVGADTAIYVGQRVALMRATYRRMAAFDRRIQHDPMAHIPKSRLFAALAGKNVMVIFIESYGRNAVEGARYAPTVDRRLARVDHELATAGLHAASAWLKSPTMGGMSWLAHGALLSGLWTHNQKRYDAMIDSHRASLNRLFRRAGWATIAVMPAITMDWPESKWFGYDRIFDAHHLGYRGKPFNWVTMPDQYTLARIHRIVAAIRKPAMVETALISSHAPWTPIPRMVPWSDVGDGTIFNPQTERGDSPTKVWADPKRVRAQYLKSIDYSLTAVGSFMARYGGNTVFIVLGDHQPAPIVTGQGATRDVPVHIVTDDPSVLGRLDQRRWTAGMRPATKAPDIGMDQFRARFVRAMSGASSDGPQSAALGDAGGEAAAP